MSFLSGLFGPKAPTPAQAPVAQPAPTPGKAPVPGMRNIHVPAGTCKANVGELDGKVRDYQDLKVQAQLEANKVQQLALDRKGIMSTALKKIVTVYKVVQSIPASNEIGGLDEQGKEVLNKSRKIFNDATELLADVDSADFSFSPVADPKMEALKERLNVLSDRYTTLVNESKAVHPQLATLLRTRIKPGRAQQ
jgi:hypothetical protein